MKDGESTKVLRCSEVFQNFFNIMSLCVVSAFEASMFPTQ